MSTKNDTMKRSILQQILKPVCQALAACGMFCAAMIPAKGQVPDFEVLSRKKMPENKMVLGWSQNVVGTYGMLKTGGKNKFNVTIAAGTFNIDALTYIEHAAKADRIITYSDDVEKHVVTNAFVKIYSGNGRLIKSLGLVAYFPFVATVAENGDFIIAGNKYFDKPQKVLLCYDKNGNKIWERNLPDRMPSKIFVDANRKYIALFSIKPGDLGGNVSYFNAQGNPLLTDNEQASVSAIEFLTAGKVVVATGRQWALYLLNGAYKKLGEGRLEGNVIGQFPVTAHPEKNTFYIVSTSANQGYQLQAFDADNGQIKAKANFGGQPYWQNYRMANVELGKVSLITDREIIELRMKQ